jgi:hypothetical protein
MSEAAKEAYEVAGLGKVGSNRYVHAAQADSILKLILHLSFESHPIHPATVHFPFAFLTVANVINLIYGTAIYLPALSPVIPHQANIGTLTILGYYVNVIGILTSLPAVLSGGAELYAMVKAKGMYVINRQTGAKSFNPLVKTAVTHVRFPFSSMRYELVLRIYIGHAQSSHSRRCDLQLVDGTAPSA